MNKKYLKFLPGVAVVLFSTSCCKDDDTVLKADDITIVKEQVAGKQVIYLRFNNASKLSKMAIKGGDANNNYGLDLENMELEFKEGDKVKLQFYCYLSDEKHAISEDDIFDVSVTITSVYDGDGFAITKDSEMKFSINTETWEKKYGTPFSDEVFKAVENLLTEKHSFDSGYDESDNKYKFMNVKLYWGEKDLDFGDNGYVVCESLQDMLNRAPRTSEVNDSYDKIVTFTPLLADGWTYALLVFEDDCQRKVTVNGNKLDPSISKYYIVDLNKKVQVDDETVYLQRYDYYADGDGIINYVRTEKPTKDPKPQEQPDVE